MTIQDKTILFNEISSALADIDNGDMSADDTVIALLERAYNALNDDIEVKNDL